MDEHMVVWGGRTVTFNGGFAEDRAAVGGVGEPVTGGLEIDDDGGGSTFGDQVVVFQAALVRLDENAVGGLRRKAPSCESRIHESHMNERSRSRNSTEPTTLART